MSFIEYGSIFSSAFLAATFFPLPSEAVLASLAALDGADVVGLVLLATIGNSLGSAVNWALGRWCLHYRDRRWFPVKGAVLARAQDHFRRWGRWSLLLSWAPFIGDPLTFVAGTMRMPILSFFAIVVVAKAGRYIVVAALTLSAVSA